MRATLPFLWLLTSALFGADVSAVTPVEARSTFTTDRAVVTGFVEGATEFLPVSSTGHLIISDALMHVPDDDVPVAGVVDRKGRAVTLKRAADDYLVIVQIGAIFAVVAGFFQRFRNPSPRGILATLVAFIPAATLGLLAKDFITEHLFRVEVVATTLLLGGLLMLWADRRWPREASPAYDELEVLTLPQAFRIGLFQCVSLIPGTSRSMSMLIGGRACGLSHAASAEFSFLVGFLTLTAASLYKAWRLGPALTQIYPVGPALIGLVVAFVVAFATVRWLVGHLQRKGFAMFAWYRIALGGGMLLYFLGRALVGG